MSDGHGHGHHDAPSQSHGLGISKFAVIFILVSLVVVTWQGANVVRSAGDAHVWPSSDAAKVPLPPEQH